MKPLVERKLLWTGIAILLLLVVLEILFLWVISPRLQIRTVELDSDLVLDDQWIYDVSGLDKDSRYLALNETDLENLIESIPQVASVEVKKRFPSTLYIHIRKRDAIALIWKENLDSQDLLAVDSRGFLFPNDQGHSAWDLPVINGMDSVTLDEGISRGSQFELLLKDLEALMVDNPSYYGIISEIRVIPREGEGFSLMLYLTTHPVAVHCDLPLDREKMEKVILVLDVLMDQENPMDIDEVDIRMGSIRYRNREV